MFSDSCRNFHQLSKFAIKNLVKGRKVKFMAFYWPFWPLKVKFWNIMQLTRSCQAFSFGFVSLNDLILKIIFGSPITRRDYVVPGSQNRLITRISVHRNLVIGPVQFFQVKKLLFTKQLKLARAPHRIFYKISIPCNREAKMSWSGEHTKPLFLSTARWQHFFACA